MDQQILLKIYESLNSGESVAMAIINQEIGSSPRRKGTLNHRKDLKNVWN